jgi:hypothetical protein
MFFSTDELTPLDLWLSTYPKTYAGESDANRAIYDRHLEVIRRTSENGVIYEMRWRADLTTRVWFDSNAAYLPTRRLMTVGGCPIGAEINWRYTKCDGVHVPDQMERKAYSKEGELLTHTVMKLQSCEVNAPVDEAVFQTDAP